MSGPQRVTTTGARHSYRSAGAGPPVLLLHGSAPGASGAFWADTVDALADSGWWAVAPDLVGFGDSERPADFRYDTTGWAGSVLDLMDALGIDSAHVVGSSMGGRIGLVLAARFPERVRSLTLAGTRSPDASLTTGLGLVRSWDGTLDDSRRLLREVLVADPGTVTDEQVLARHELATRPGEVEHYRAMFSSPLAGETGLGMDALAALAVPVLVVHGRADRVIPVEHALRTAAVVPDVVLALAPGCGHLPSMEEPAWFLSQLASHLSRVEGRAIPAPAG